jgi:hypothetical protein
MKVGSEFLYFDDEISLSFTKDTGYDWGGKDSYVNIIAEGYKYGSTENIDCAVVF